MADDGAAEGRTVLILIADGTEEIEFVTPYDVLVRAGFTVKSVGVNLSDGTHARCSRGVVIKPDIASIHSLPNPWSLVTQTSPPVALIIPGGAVGAATISASPEARALISCFRGRGILVGAICAGTLAIVAARDSATMPDGSSRVRVTSHPSVKDEIVRRGWEYADDDERVVSDRRVVTSRGPGSALAWSLRLVEELAGREAREVVAGPMMCAATL